MHKRRQNGFGLVWIALVVVAIIALVGFAVWKVASGSSASSSSGSSASIRTADPKDTDAIITASPVDPTQLKFITKFRSCGGHEYFSTPDYSGLAEGDSSMKHYFYVANQYLGIPNAVKLYAPFDGTVHFMEIGGTGKGAVIEHQPFDGWYVVVYHVDPVVTDGASLKSGQLLGYDHSTSVVSFDIAMQRFKTEINPAQDGSNTLVKNLESMFTHMDSAVAAEWAAHGVTPANAVVDRASRVANPCQCAANQPQQAAGFKSSECYFTGTPANDDIPISI
jgi:hypothetical protein